MCVSYFDLSLHLFKIGSYEKKTLVMHILKMKTTISLNNKKIFHVFLYSIEKYHNTMILIIIYLW